ncbi:formimidoyltetrahydrofolate cyclodeaminase [Halorubrum sp. BOL3-1]|uniref:cyclodeaminase/cyclohydrolase family protein n=1 Tax=Halorubrum sp. BOL3-1 TaxID=2497325 RepID=UPI00100513C6|nr:cyclodeaminase/cyclohydrolase family protein [Halorubrum sp. BOL3-1]QAU13998.1 formimidoyltetrahydrofolate cyclodeaminase [Halorubrum sp. BOL3-1]
MNDETQPLAEFLSEVASATVSPASGTVVGVVAGMGTALCEMVCVHLRNAAVRTDADLAELQRTLKSERERLLTLAEADAAVVEELFGTGDGGDDPSVRKRSVGIPLALAESCLTVLEAASVVTGAADRPVVVDAGIGASFVDVALRSALFTVRTNVASVDDESFRAETERRVADIESAAERAARLTMENAGTDGIGRSRE